jgi:predicted O-linked N-acetylglucosamine transferase (SPINDLY family)
MGAEFMDYIVADEILVPVDQQDNYTEKIIYLPCYQPNDSKREISDKKMSRVDFGLKEDSFVFCCFNNAYKISPDVFDSWMQILTKTPNSLLWLVDNGEATTTNLKKEAVSRGVDPGRIIFAKNIPIPEYLARFKLADLFLDTYPYNAGTVGSDALRMGLPLLTLCGNTFSSRMAASLLHAVNLDDLIAQSQDEYESLAVSMYEDNVKYSSIKTRLLEILPRSNLFNIERFTRSIETAFEDIYEHYQTGESPRHFIIKN